MVGILVCWLPEITTIEIPENVLEKIVAVVIAYVVGQGIADIGKEAAKAATAEEEDIGFKS